MIFQTLKSNKGNLIEGPLLLDPKIFNDERGYFYESWNQKILTALWANKLISHKIMSHSQKNGC